MEVLMTGFYDAVLQRHSVRRYSPTPVPEDKLHRVMAAARLSPSGGNRQGYRFIIVRDRSVRTRLVAAAGNQGWMTEAPVIIACCAKPELPVSMGNSATMIPGTHLTLAAAAEGLGTCWVGYLDIEAASRHLGLPDDWKCYFLITLGYPSEPVRRGGHSRMALEDMVFIESWGQRWPKASELCSLSEAPPGLGDGLLSAISALDTKPELYAPHGAPFWDHPHIARWRPGPYVEFTRYYTDPEAGAHLRQTIIAEEDGSASVYRIWRKAYAQAEIERVLGDAGFSVEGAWESLSGTELRDDSPSLAIIARKM